MLKKFLKLSAVLTGVMGFAGAANATISAAGSVGGAATGVTFVNFDTTTATPIVAGASVASTCPVPPVQVVGLTFAGGASYMTGSTPNVAAPPFLSGGNGNGFGFVAPGPVCGNQANGADASQYLLVPNGGSITIALPALENYLGLLWGSIDPFNTLTFKKAGVTVGSFTGTQILVGANGNQGVNGTLYVNFTSNSPTTSFDSIVLASSGFSFEADNLAFNPTVPKGVPEPLTLGLFGAGLAGLGFVRRKAKKA